MDGADDFSELVRQEYLPQLRTAIAITRDEGIAREVVQEAFTRALVRWRRLSTYERPGAWLRLVTVRLAIRAASRQRRDWTIESVEPTGVADEVADLDLRAAIASLPVADRTVIVLRYLCDLSIDEVARVTKARPGAVKVRLHRARQRLATALAMEVDDVVR